MRLKKNVKPLSGALDELLLLKGVTFEWKNPEQHENHIGPQMGVIAQDVEKVFPQWVRETEAGFKNVDPDARTVLALTVESIRSLKTENDSLREAVKAQNARLDALEGKPRLSSIVPASLRLLSFGGVFALGAAFVVSRRKRSDS
jgi:hypothetical protein